jgi:chemotaxis signal transduction protein
MANSLTDTNTQNVILFNLDRYWLALPVPAVLKVVNFPSHFRTALNQIGIVHLGESQVNLETPARAIALLNLDRYLSDQTTSIEGRFLIVARLSDRQLAGIPVDEPPSLLPIPDGTIRPLAASHRQSQILNLASHVAVLPAEKGSIEVFLLDLEKMEAQLAQF